MTAKSQRNNSTSMRMKMRNSVQLIHKRKSRRLPKPRLDSLNLRKRELKKLPLKLRLRRLQLKDSRIKKIKRQERSKRRSTRQRKIELITLLQRSQRRSQSQRLKPHQLHPLQLIFLLSSLELIFLQSSLEPLPKRRNWVLSLNKSIKSKKIPILTHLIVMMTNERRE